MCLLELSPQAMQFLLFIIGLITGIIACRIVTYPIENKKPKLDRYGRCMYAVQKAKANFEPSALPPSPPKSR